MDAFQFSLNALNSVLELARELSALIVPLDSITLKTPIMPILDTVWLAPLDAMPVPQLLTVPDAVMDIT